VDGYPPNGFGLHNMTGNVWEWCHDWLQLDYYRRSPVRAPTGPADGSFRVQRGGSFLCHSSYCSRYRVSARFGSEPTVRPATSASEWLQTCDACRGKSGKAADSSLRSTSTPGSAMRAFLGNE
ncbi:MAG: formylglycine-generating enzyme family protein, partial [Mycobacterium sp.]